MASGNHLAPNSNGALRKSTVSSSFCIFTKLKLFHLCNEPKYAEMYDKIKNMQKMLQYWKDVEYKDRKSTENVYGIFTRSHS